MKNEEAATHGAARLAGKALGVFASIGEAAEHIVRIERTFEPTPDNVKTYNDANETYKELNTLL